MPAGQPAVLHHGPHRLAQVQQPQGVGHGGTGLAYTFGRFLLGHVVLLHQHLVPLGLFDGVQILTLQVLDHGQLHGLAVVGLNDHSRHLSQPRHTGGAPPALTGNDLVIAGLELPHRQRLDDAVLPDGVGQVGQCIGVKQLARLGRAGLYLTDGQHQTGLFLVEGHHIVAHKSAETLSEALGYVCHTASPFRRFLSKIPPPARCRRQLRGSCGRKR